VNKCRTIMRRPVRHLVRASGVLSKRRASKLEQDDGFGGSPGEDQSNEEEVHRGADRLCAAQVESVTSPADVCNQLGVSEATNYIWKKKYAHLGRGYADTPMVAAMGRDDCLRDPRRRRGPLGADSVHHPDPDPAAPFGARSTHMPIPSVLIHLGPVFAINWWFQRRCRETDGIHDRRSAHRWTLVTLIPMGFVLNILIGYEFLTFRTRADSPAAAVLVGVVHGVALRAAHFFEEFAFYTLGFDAILSSDIWRGSLRAPIVSNPVTLAPLKAAPILFRSAGHVV
jgi:hypothetical protein